MLRQTCVKGLLAEANDMDRHSLSRTAGGYDKQNGVF